ncbi:hypothetical protein [Micrococcus sp. ACRRV]|uniref:hypothetical protein n=1 Tax=Micrococcus sp. ACRRV TaxID=2918203 RepID=UPI001EF19B69|nr:hypothetical protein [Micrococcus sp. ACRRV]
MTRISIVFGQERLWFWTDVEPPILDYVDSAGVHHSEPQPSGTPAFVSDLLNRVDLVDGIETPSSHIQLIASESHVDHLEQVLRDDSRRGVVYVTTPPEGVSDSAWLTKVEKILGPFEGMAFAFMLTGGARVEFNSRVADGHRIPAGSIRTVLPGAGLSDPNDSFRHRLIHSSTIEKSTHRRLQRIVRRRQVEHLRNTPLPEVLRDADYSFLREKSARAFHAVRGDVSARASSSSDSPSIATQALADAEELLNIALDENEKLREEAEFERVNAGLLRLENDEMLRATHLLRTEEERLRREIDYLKQSLINAGGAELAHSFVDVADEVFYPSTFAQLMDSFDRLSGVKFFGDRGIAEELDEYSDLGDSAIQKAWDSLLTFEAYVKARREGDFSGSLSHYVKNAQHGLLMRAVGIKWGEGQTVRENGKMKGQRTVYGLPREVSADGSKLMVAHVALATGRAGSPRMYFDDTFSACGFVAVGYIGPHLDNTLTN